MNKVEVQGEEQKIKRKKIQNGGDASFHNIGFRTVSASKVGNALALKD